MYWGRTIGRYRTTGNTSGNKAGKHPATIPHHTPAVRIASAWLRNAPCRYTVELSATNPQTPKHLRLRCYKCNRDYPIKSNRSASHTPKAHDETIKDILPDKSPNSRKV